jgi:outer membrane lipoprotein LolB
MHMIPKRRCALWLCAFALAGCATTGTPTPSTANATVGAYRDTVALTGRLAVTYQKDNQPQSINGNFTWNQSPGRVEVALASPLGQTLANIVVTPESATLTQAGRPPREAHDIDALTEQALGWPLPVAGLRDWLQGYATAAGGKRFTASPANNSVMTQDGWRLRFVDWQGATPPMPRRIDASRSTTSVGDELAIRIVIDPAS